MTLETLFRLSHGNSSDLAARTERQTSSSRHFEGSPVSPLLFLCLTPNVLSHPFILSYLIPKLPKRNN